MMTITQPQFWSVDNSRSSVSVVKTLTHLRSGSLCGQLTIILAFTHLYNLGKERVDGSRGTPKYPPILWNMNERVKGDLPLTTNGLEFWHSSIRAIMVESHTSMARFISDLWPIASEVETKTELVLARIPGALPKRTTASILEYARRYDIVTRYEEYPDIVSFLTALSIKAETVGLQAWE